MESLYLLIPLALILVIIIIWIFLWAVKSDQFDDLEGPAHRIIMDNDDSIEETKTKNTSDDISDKKT